MDIDTAISIPLLWAWLIVALVVGLFGGLFYQYCKARRNGRD